MGTAFAYFAIFGIACGVCILAVVIAVMNGFQWEICQKIRNIGGDIFIHTPNLRMEEGIRLEEWIRRETCVESAALLRAKPIILMKEGRISLPTLVERRSDDRWLQRHAIEEAHDQTDKEGIWLGGDLAQELRVFAGETVQTLAPENLFRQRKRKKSPAFHIVQIAGIFRTDWEELDRRTVFSEHLIGDGALAGVEVHLRGGYDARDVSERWNREDLVQPLRATPWQESNRQLLAVLGLEKVAMFFVLSFVLAIVSFSIASALILQIFRKRREIGLLRAMGATKMAVLVSYFYQGIILGSFGILLGNLLAFAALHYRDFLLGYVLKLCGNGDEILSFYQFSHLPVSLSGNEMIIICALAMALTVAASAVAALWTVRISPSRALAGE
ncbi:MAG: FtsX-like permease family protein [Puniceicoccales bacterium]|jgi:lipoprotein-releasing system permease protein|nr:FtsX-like permease family protein [Puniceicoccales bacterium]